MIEGLWIEMSSDKLKSLFNVRVGWRAKIRLDAFKLLEGWGVVENPKAESPLDRLPTPWNLTERMRRAAELADWAMSPQSEQQERE